MQNSIEILTFSILGMIYSFWAIFLKKKQKLGFQTEVLYLD